MAVHDHRRAPWLVVCLTLVGCGLEGAPLQQSGVSRTEPGAADGGGPTPDRAVGAPAAADGLAPTPDRSPACTGLALPANRDYTLKLKHGGRTRTARVHIPPGYDPATPAPLVFSNHGQMCSASFHAAMTGLDAAADKRGVIVVTPQGTGGLLAGWNVGQSPMGFVYDKVDDVGLFGKLIDELGKTLCIDRGRVFCTGFSLGGSMCYRLACDLSQRIAAIASVAGPNAPKTCKPARALPLLHIHGTADGFASYAGDAGGPNPGAPGSVTIYAKRRGCAATPKPSFSKGAVTCQTHGGCRDGAHATLCTAKGGGHTWPGGKPWLLGGAVNQDIDASAMVLDFFLKGTFP